MEIPSTKVNIEYRYRYQKFCNLEGATTHLNTNFDSNIFQLCRSRVCRYHRKIRI